MPQGTGRHPAGDRPGQRCRHRAHPDAQDQLSGSKNPRLHTDEILIALSSSAATNELAAAALHQLPNLKGCDVHSTVLLSGVDTGTLNRLGMYLTCDPVYEEEDRKYHKQ